MLTKNVVRSLTLAALATLATTPWVVEASALMRVSSCPQTLNVTGETCYLTADLRPSGPCLIVTADRVTTDFKDHSITGDGSGAAVTDGGIARLLTTVERGTDLAATLRSEVRGMSANFNTDDGSTLGTCSMTKSCMVGQDGGIQ
jgi:hypothetical protein